MSISISVVIPVYGGARTLPALVERIEKTLSCLAVTYEIILVDDCGPEDSWTILQRIAVDSSRVRCIQLMRNFGQHNALMCGFRHARGEIIVTMDDDSQHDPEAISKLLSRMGETEADLVYGVYEQKRHAAGRNLGSWLVNRFYRLVFRMPITVTSLRAIRRELVEAIVRYDLNFTYIDGLLAWNTQRITEVAVCHQERADGRSGYTLPKLAGLAMNVFTNFSLLPLQLVTGLGLLSSGLGIVLALWYLVLAVLSQVTVPGYASTIVAVLFLGGVQLLSLGILGEYIGRLHLNVNRKPQYTIRRKYEGDKSDL